MKELLIGLIILFGIIGIIYITLLVLGILGILFCNNFTNQIYGWTHDNIINKGASIGIYFLCIIIIFFLAILLGNLVLI